MSFYHGFLPRMPNRRRLGRRFRRGERVDKLDEGFADGQISPMTTLKVMQGESLATSVTEALREPYLLAETNRETRSLPNCRSLRESFGGLTFGLTWRST